MKLERLAVLSLLLVFLMGVSFGAPPAWADGKTSSSAYERIEKTGVLRCGYVSYDPWLLKDPNTDKFSGIFYEITELAAKKLNLKVEWTTETGFGTFVTDIQNNRFDALCSASWETPAYARHVKFSQPAFYMPVYAVVRAGDTRFDTDIARINSPDVTIVTLDGDVSGMIRDENFPQAKLSTLQNMTDFMQVFMDVGTRKADVTFADLDSAQRYAAHNPGKIKIIQTAYPVRLYPTSLVYRIDDPALDSMMQSALRELVYSGEVHKILQKYKADPKTYLEVAPPYGPAPDLAGSLNAIAAAAGTAHK